MKIAGAINDYQEALDIEDIVKVFIIEQRLLNLSSLETSKVFKNEANPNIIKFLPNSISYSKTSNKKNYK